MRVYIVHTSDFNSKETIENWNKTKNTDQQKQREGKYKQETQTYIDIDQREKKKQWVKLRKMESPNAMNEWIRIIEFKKKHKQKEKKGSRRARPSFVHFYQ